MSTRSGVEQDLENLIKENRWAEASKLVGHLVQKYPGQPSLRYWQGVVWFQLRRPIAAIMAFRSAERMGLNTEALHEALGLAYFLIHQYILFEKEMNEAIRIDPTDYAPVYYLGRYYEFTRQDLVRARELFDKAIKLNPDNPKSVFNRGYCLEMLGNLDEARANYERAMRLVEAKHERYSWPYQGMARLLLMDHPQQALSFAQKAVELQPDLASNHLILARVDERLGKLSQAVEELQAVTRLDPAESSPHYVLSRLYAKMHNQKAAETELKLFEELGSVYEQQ